MTTEQNISDITIVGGGPVGLFAAFYAGMRGAKVKIIESLSELGGQPAILYPEKMIYDIPAYPAISGGDLVKQLVSQLDRFSDILTVCLKEEVKTFQKVDEFFSIKTNKGEHLTKSIIMACGNGAFAPRQLGLDNEESFTDQNLYYNVSRLEQFADQDVVICGGGDSAVDWALALENIAKSVTLVHRRDKFRAHEHSVDLLEASSVKRLTPFVPKEIIGENDQAKGLIIQEVKGDKEMTLNLDALIVSYGFSNSNANLKKWEIDSKRSNILVSPTFETSMPGVFAIGDSADYQGKVDLIATGFGEAPIAVNQAMQFIRPDEKVRPVHSTSLIQ